LRLFKSAAILLLFCSFVSAKERAIIGEYKKRDTSAINLNFSDLNSQTGQLKKMAQASDLSDGWMETNLNGVTGVIISSGPFGTFSVQGDATKFFRKGLALRYSQSGSTKYAYITNSTFYTSSTTIQTAGDSSSNYLVSGSSVSNISVAPDNNASGFPGLFEFYPQTQYFSVITSSKTFYSVSDGYVKFSGYIDGNLTDPPGILRVKTPISPNFNKIPRSGSFGALTERLFQNGTSIYPSESYISSDGYYYIYPTSLVDGDTMIIEFNISYPF
jgi:hypothetical protein